MKSFLVTLILLVGAFALTNVSANPVAIGYTPGELVPVKVFCKEQEHMSAFIKGNPELLSKEEQTAIMLNCMILPKPAWVVLTDCVEGPLYDPTLKMELSVCRSVVKEGVDVYIQLPYTHPNLKPA